MMAGSRLGWRFDALSWDSAVVHSPVGYGPRFRHARLINHVHDVTYLTNPEWHTRKTSTLFRWTAAVASRDASLVLTDCEWVKEQVVRYFGVPAEPLLAIPLPLDP